MAASRVDRESSLGFADGEQQNAVQDLSSDDLCLPSSSTSLLAAPASTPCTTYSMFQQCHVNQPDRLKTSSVHSLETIFYLIIPLPFIALAVMLLLAEGKELHAATWTFSQYQDYTKIASTAFPIAFAAVVGQMVSQVARWRLETGVELGILEQLNGSKTVFGTLATHVSLRSFNALGIALILFWTVSPFGSQSALRLMGTGNRDSFGTFESTYFDTMGEPLFASWLPNSTNAPNEHQSDLAQLNSMYTASILSPDSVRAGLSDPWGNAKIPLLPPNVAESNTSWLNVNSSTVKNSALAGMVGADARRADSRWLTWESTYIDVRCSNITTSRTPRVVDYHWLEGVVINGSSGRSSRAINGTFRGARLGAVNASWTIALDTFVDEIWYSNINKSVDWSMQDRSKGDLTPTVFIHESDIENHQGTLLFQEGPVRLSGQLQYNIAHCRLSQVYVESRYDSKAGAVVAQRRSTATHANTNITQLSFPQIMYQMSRITSAFGQTSGGSFSDPAMYYIAGANFTTMTAPRDFARIDLLSADDFSRRLGALINTYLMLGNAFTAIVAPRPESQDAFKHNLTTTVHATFTKKVFVVSSFWMTAFLVSVAAMTGAAIANLVFANLAVTPRLLDSASLAIRNSKFVTVPHGGKPAGILDGLDLARYNKKLKLQYGVVERTDEGIGILGTSTVGKVDRVKKCEKYM